MYRRLWRQWTGKFDRVPMARLEDGIVRHEYTGWAFTPDDEGERIATSLSWLDRQWSGAAGGRVSHGDGLRACQLVSRSRAHSTSVTRVAIRRESLGAGSCDRSSDVDREAGRWAETNRSFAPAEGRTRHGRRNRRGTGRALARRKLEPRTSRSGARIAAIVIILRVHPGRICAGPIRA
jgi:hypothetical protein